MRYAREMSTPQSRRGRPRLQPNHSDEDPAEQILVALKAAESKLPTLLTTGHVGKAVNGLQSLMVCEYGSKYMVIIVNVYHSTRNLT